MYLHNCGHVLCIYFLEFMGVTQQQTDFSVASDSDVRCRVTKWK